MAKKQKARLGRVGRVEREQRLNKIIRLTTLVVIALIVVVVISGAIINLLITPNIVIATAYGEEITVGDFQVRVRMQRAQLVNTINQYSNFYQQVTDPNLQQQILSYVQQIQYQLEPPEYMGQTVLNEMIDNIIIKEEAQARGITITEEELTEVVNNYFGYYPNGVPTFTPVPTAVPTETSGEETGVDGENAEVVAPTTPPEPTSITLDEYKQTLATYFDNLDVRGANEQVLFELFEAQLYREKLSEVLSEGVNKLEDQVWARHILVEDEETAATVLERLENGEAFEDLAVELSIDTGSGAEGGDLGWFNENRMVPEFGEAAFGAEVGDIVGPVESEFGFHIIEILGHEMREMSEADFNNQIDLVLYDLINETKTFAEESGVIVLEEDWQKYTPDDPRSPLSNQPTQ